MAVAAEPPPEGWLPGTARGRRGLHAEAREPLLASSCPPGAALERWRQTRQPRAPRPWGPGRARGTAGARGGRDPEHCPTGYPPLPASATSRPGRGPRGLAAPLPGSPPAQSARPAPPNARFSTHRVKQEQVCSQMRRSGPLPRCPAGLLLLRPPAQNQTVQIKVLLLPGLSPPPALPRHLERSPVPSSPAPGPAAGEGKWASERGLPLLQLPFSPQLPPELTPGPRVGAAALW